MQFGPFAFFPSVNNYLTATDGSSLQLVAPNEIVAGFFAVVVHWTPRLHFCLVYPSTGVFLAQAVYMVLARMLEINN